MMSCLGGVVALLASLFSEGISAVQSGFAECQWPWGKRVIRSRRISGSSTQIPSKALSGWRRSCPVG